MKTDLSQSAKKKVKKVKTGKPEKVGGEEKKVDESQSVKKKVKKAKIPKPVKDATDLTVQVEAANKKKKLKATAKSDDELNTQVNGKGAWKKGKIRERGSKKTSSLTIKLTEGEKWYTLQSTEEPQLSNGEETKVLPREEIDTIKKRASTLLEKDVSAYTTYCTEGDGRGDFLWMNKILKTGTLPDKMAAFTVRIQNSPVHGLHYLQQLIGMVKPQGKQQCLMVSDTVRDLFLEDLLPPNRKLKTFESRGFNLRGASDKLLILWLFEDRLKLQYFNFIEAVRKMSSDQIEKLRGKGISIVEKLLSSHPEKEDQLLQILVNKLGDPVKKVGSRALFHLNQLLFKHPQMKIIVVGEVERLLFRNNVSSRARYYGICFLNALRLNVSEASLATKLVKVYLAFFKACVKTGEIDSKLMGGLLTGVNNSFPIAKLVGCEFTESLDVLFKIVQLSQFSVGVQALALLSQVTEGNPKESDRFYRILYRKLLDTEIATTSHGMQFLNIVYKAMKKDTIINRIQGFAKRLLQICGSSPPNMVCGILFLISEVAKVHEGILILDNLNDIKPDLATNQEEEEDEESRKKSNKKKADLEHLLRTTNVQVEESEVKRPIINEESTDDLDKSVIVEGEVKEEKYSRVTEYDPLARNPTFCGAEKTHTFELIPLSEHFHPSVAHFAQTLLARNSIKYDGNPLKDFTVSHFLERFVYRNPKENVTRQEYQPQGLRSVPVNSSAYLNVDEQSVPIEEKFFYKYFKENKKGIQGDDVKKEEDEDIDSDAESVGDEEFDDIMGNYFKSNGAVMSDEEDVDFISNVKKTKGKKGKNSMEDEESEEEDAEDEDGSFGEGSGDDDADEFIEMDSGEEAEFDAEDGDFDEGEDEGLLDLGEDDSDGDDDDEFSDLKSRLKLPSSKKDKLRRAMKSKDVFAPAEEFSEMLESNATTSFSGSHTLINADNSDAKQMKWEANRDRWVKGYKRSNKGSFSGGPAKRRKFK